MKKFKNILLIDDDPLSNFITKSLIIDSQTSEQVFIAENGRDGLSLLKKGFSQDACPEVVLLDINMPVMDGLQFLENYEGDIQLKGKNKIVLLTSSVNRKDIEKAKKYNIAGFINKPLTLDKFRKLFDGMTNIVPAT